MKLVVTFVVIYAVLRGLLAIAGFYSIGILNAAILGAVVAVISQWLVKPATE
jgi:hypothetical protein